MEQMTEKQRRVVEAALEVFAERGFAGASTSEIAKRAGVAEGTIFRHYKTKKELLIGVVAPFFFRVFGPALMQEVLDVVEAEHESFEDLVRALYQNRLDFVRKHEQRVRVIAQELPFHPEVRALLEQEVVSRVFPRLAAVVRRYQARGELIDTDPASIVRVILSTLMSYVVLRFVLAPHRSWDDALEMELNVKVVVDGLRPREP
jgi:AcrR family transcriptional regulator